MKPRSEISHLGLLDSSNFKLTFSQPSGGSRAKNLLICGEVPNLLKSSGDDPRLPATSKSKKF